MVVIADYSVVICSNCVFIVCILDEKINFRCGLNHLGDGNFFVIVAGKCLEQLNKKVGSLVHFRIEQDPDQLGVVMPEVLEVLLSQDEELKSIFDKITDGKKRSLIYAILKTKDLDKQVQTAVEFLNKKMFKLDINKIPPSGVRGL